MEILFEDEHLIAVNKPSGVPSNTLRQSAHSEPSIESQLQRLYAPSPIHLLHRLDVGTSGVLLFARSNEVFDEIRLLFQQKKIRKLYWAWSRYSCSFSLPYEIKEDLAHHSKSSKRMIVVDPVKMSKRPQTFYRGKPLPAQTRILAVSRVEWLGETLYRYEVEIPTGVMHQIRVHLHHLGIPLVGDAIYTDSKQKDPDVFPRLGLHAKRIEFTFRGYLYQIEAPAP